MSAGFAATGSLHAAAKNEGIVGRPDESVPQFQPATSVAIRAFGTSINDGRGWSRMGRGIGLGVEWATNLTDALRVELCTRPSRWRDASHRVVDVTSGTFGLKHLIVTDMMAGSWFVTPWVDVGVGLAHLVPRDGPQVLRDGRFEGTVRFGTGVDVWTTPRFAWFACWSVAARSPRVLYHERYDREFELRTGILALPLDGGRSR